MKKLIAFVLVTLMAVSALAVAVSAVDTNSRTGIEFEITTVGGVKQPTGYYVAEKRLEKMPITLEAWVYIPKAVHSSRVGAILANYVGFKKDDFINFEIQQGGIPRLVLSDLSGEMKDFLFPKAMIKPDVWTHVAIVYGTGTDNQQILCYINGVLKQSTKTSQWYAANPETVDNTLCLGGDTRTLNTQAFKGSLGDVWAYSDVRSAEEIKADYEKGPDTSDGELLLYYELSDNDQNKDVADSSKNGYDMKYYSMWLDESEMQAIRDADPYEYTYSIAFLPDIQYSTQHSPESLAAIYDFLLDSAESKNIKYVIGLGDITNRNTAEEWATIKKQTDRIDGKLPYSLIRGNHDITYNNYAELFDATYGKGTYYYDHVAKNGGFMDEKTVKNTYLLFSVGEVDYIILNLDFGATDDILAWAGEILDKYPDHRAIIATHGYFNADATTLDANDYATPSSYSKKWNDGDDMWEKLLRKHENIDLVVSGHIGQDDLICAPAEGDNGNTVYQMLLDTQVTDNTMKGQGFVAMMYFTADGNHARVECYSTVLKKYFRESNINISLDFGVPEPETEAPVVTDAPVLTTLPEVTEAPETTAAPAEGGCGGSILLALPAVMSVGVAVCARKRRRK